MNIATYHETGSVSIRFAILRKCFHVIQMYNIRNFSYVLDNHRKCKNVSNMCIFEFFENVRFVKLQNFNFNLKMQMSWKNVLFQHFNWTHENKSLQFHEICKYCNMKIYMVWSYQMTYFNRKATIRLFSVKLL